MIKTIIQSVDGQYSKGKFVKVIEVNDLGGSFIDYNFSPRTIKTIFWAGFSLDYIGG
jgi:hypothetical protein